MFFWIGLCILSLCCLAIVHFVDKPFYKKINIVLLVLVWWFITAFRYMIGLDYDTYTRMFYSVSIDYTYPEISFILICNFFDYIGFDYQIIFIFYSVLLFFFLWKGFKIYRRNDIEYLMMFILYIFMPYLYWSGLSIIRQELALAIFLWSSKFILEKNLKKYTLALLFATFWHYSAIALFPLYWISIFKTKKIFYLLIIALSYFVANSGILLSIIQNLFNLLNVSIYEGYLIDPSKNEIKSGLGILFYIVVYIFMLISSDLTILKNRLLLNISTVFLINIFLLSFSETLTRMNSYMASFFIVFLSRSISLFNNRNNTLIGYIFIFLFGVIFVNFLAQISQDTRFHMVQSESVDNINYRFNFKLFQ